MDSENKLPALLCDFGAATYYASDETPKKKLNFDILELVEVRAWAILADELLGMASVEKRDQPGGNNDPSGQLLLENTMQRLKDLKSRCFSEKTLERPRFSSIASALAPVILSNKYITTNKSSRLRGIGLNLNAVTVLHIGGIALTAFCAIYLFRNFSCWINLKSFGRQSKYSFMKLNIFA